MARNTFKAKEQKGQGLCENIEDIKDKIRKSKVVRARLTEAEKAEFITKLGEHCLVESNVIRQLVNAFSQGKIAFDKFTNTIKLK